MQHIQQESPRLQAADLQISSQTSQIFPGCNSINAFNNTTMTKENTTCMVISILVFRNFIWALSQLDSRNKCISLQVLLCLLDLLMSLFELKIIPDYIEEIMTDQKEWHCRKGLHISQIYHGTYSKGLERRKWMNSLCINCSEEPTTRWLTALLVPAPCNHTIWQKNTIVFTNGQRAGVTAFI